MVSTKHVGERVNTGKFYFQSEVEVRKSDAIFDYKLNMGGVDTLSGVIIPYNIQRKGGNK